MSTSEKEATMIYIKIDNDLFYDDAVVLVRSFYPRTEVTALKADSKPEDDDEIIRDFQKRLERNFRGDILQV